MSQAFALASAIDAGRPGLSGYGLTLAGGAVASFVPTSPSFPFTLSLADEANGGARVIVRSGAAFLTLSPVEAVAVGAMSFEPVRLSPAASEDEALNEIDAYLDAIRDEYKAKLNAASFDPKTAYPFHGFGRFLITLPSDAPYKRLIAAPGVEDRVREAAGDSLEDGMLYIAGLFDGSSSVTAYPARALARKFPAAVIEPEDVTLAIRPISIRYGFSVDGDPEAGDLFEVKPLAAGYIHVSVFSGSPRRYSTLAAATINVFAGTEAVERALDSLFSLAATISAEG